MGAGNVAPAPVSDVWAASGNPAEKRKAAATVAALGVRPRGTVSTSSVPRPCHQLRITVRLQIDESAQGGFHWVPVISIHYALFHHEQNTLRYFDVVERIAGDGDDVGEFTGFERSYLSLQPQEIGGRRGSRAERVSGSHAVGGHQDELERVVPMRINGGVGAERDFHAEGQRATHHHILLLDGEIGFLAHQRRELRL